MAIVHRLSAALTEWLETKAATRARGMNVRSGHIWAARIRRVGAQDVEFPLNGDVMIEADVHDETNQIPPRRKRRSVWQRCGVRAGRNRFGEQCISRQIA